jgi:hypothetical protein
MKTMREIESLKLVRIKKSVSITHSLPSSIGVCVRPLTQQEITDEGYDPKGVTDPPWFVHFKETGPVIVFQDELEEVR